MEQNGNGNHIFDIPGPTPTSIGFVDRNPVYASENRAKNIHPEVMTSPKSFLDLVVQFRQYPLTREITRYSTRVFVSDRVLRSIGKVVNKEWIERYIEGIIPLDGCESAIDDCALVYLGKNILNRTTPPLTLQEEIAKTRYIFSLPEDQRQQPISPEFNIRVLTPADRDNPEIQMQYAELYSAFNYDRDDVNKMLSSPNNTMVAMFDGQVIVSTGMIEHATLELVRDGQPVNFNIGEVTEGFTREEANGKVYRGRGLYTHVISELMKNEANNGINLVYAESNADASITQPYPPVLLSAKRQGRLSTIDVFDEYGFRPNLLQRHVHIKNDSMDNRPLSVHNDLIPTFMVRKELLIRYGKGN